MVGVRRRLASLHAGISERNGASRHSIAEQWFFYVVGAQGELAAAKALQVYWPASINAKKADADLLPNIQVRTLERHDYDLLVRADDPGPKARPRWDWTSASVRACARSSATAARRAAC